MRSERYDLPIEVDAMAGAVNGTTHGLDVQDSMFRVHRTLKRPFLPFLQVTHQTITSVRNLREGQAPAGTPQLMHL